MRGTAPAGAVAVFGSSEPAAGSAEYETARHLGRLLAERGLTVVNGGYGGVMEAVSRGAREAGGRAVGVTTAAFAARGGGNRFLSEELQEPDLHARTRTLVERAAGFVVLPGRSGTLAELAMLWALERGRLLGPKPVVLLGPGWPRLVEELRRMEFLEDGARHPVRYAETAEEAAGLVALGLESYQRFCDGEPLR